MNSFITWTLDGNDAVGEGDGVIDEGDDFVGDDGDAADDDEYGVDANHLCDIFPETRFLIRLLSFERRACRLNTLVV